MTRYLTFDCYDTLVQYSAGKRACMAILARRKAADADVDAIVAAQGAAEKALHLGPFQPLRPVLRQSLRQAFAAAGLACEDSDGDALEAAVRFATPFGEARETLTRLAERYRLVIVSNSEPEIIADNMAAIGAPFHAAITAAEVGAYKPDRRMFAAVLERLGCTRDDVIHVAAGFYHDIEPLHALGWRRVWINRAGRAGDRALMPYEQLPDLTGLPDLLAD